MELNKQNKTNKQTNKDSSSSSSSNNNNNNSSNNNNNNKQASKQKPKLICLKFILTCYNAKVVITYLFSVKLRVSPLV